MAKHFIGVIHFNAVQLAHLFQMYLLMFVLQMLFLFIIEDFLGVRHWSSSFILGSILVQVLV